MTIKAIKDHLRQGEEGVSVLELIIALLIAAFLVGVVYELLLVGVKTSTVQGEVITMQQNARVAIDQIVKELRMAGYDPNAPGGIQAILVPGAGGTCSEGSPLPGSSSDSLCLQGDLDNDGVVERVTYQLDRSDPAHPLLTRCKDCTGASAPVIMADNIENLTLRFYDRTNQETAVLTPGDAASVQRVTVSVTARTDQPDPLFPANGGRRTITLESDVFLRNTNLT